VPFIAKLRRFSSFISKHILCHYPTSFLTDTELVFSVKTESLLVFLEQTKERLKTKQEKAVAIKDSQRTDMLLKAETK